MAILLGAIVGFMVGQIPGMVIGAILGLIYQKVNLSVVDETDYSDSILLKNLPIITAWMTIATGNSKTLVLSIKRFAIQTFGTERAKVFMDNFKGYVTAGLSFDRLRSSCNEINYSFGLHERYSLIQLLFEIIKLREDFTRDEIKIIAEIADLLGLHINMGSDSESDSEHHIKTPEHSPYETLELPENAPTEAIKKQYRKLSMIYHPDRNANLSDSERIKAEVKMRELNSAYEKIKKERNFK